VRAVAILLLLCGCDPLQGVTVVHEDRCDLPISGIDAAWTERFAAGDAAFDAPFRESQGLGPLYIRIACESCHEGDARGPGDVRKMSVLGADGRPSADQSALTYGPTLRPLVAAGAARPIEAPHAIEVRITRRIGPAVFGRGYLEAIADTEIERVAREQNARGVVSGRIHRVAYQSQRTTDRRFHEYGPESAQLIGRFGHKARIATIDDFAADAYQGDMGLTSPLRPTELDNPEGILDDRLPGIDVEERIVQLTADYVRLLAIPRRENVAAPSSFAGCAECHVPSMHTRADYPIAALAGIDARVYSDLLLHDMGRGLEDGVRDGDASGSEWRTAPLIGLRHFSSYLHDGRASTIEEAIAAHRSEGSEANASVDAFDALSARDRRALVAFVAGL
jgi:CxxC motif-containing protein (DUF1111 family)